MNKGLILAAIGAIIAGAVVGRVFLRPAVTAPNAGVLKDAIAVPSGLPVRFHETIRDGAGGGLTYRFRFVAPSIGQIGGPGFEDVADDMAHLCTTYALPRIANIGPQPGQIVISLADRETKFGVITEGVTQFFESYKPENGVCIWELF